MRALASLLSVGAALIGAMPAAAQETGSRQTREFVQMAAQSDSFEMLEARTALAESTNANVKAFAQAMIRDHERTSAGLMDAVGRSKLQPPAPGIGGDQSGFLAALQSLRGPEFDRAYAKQQVLAHHAAQATDTLYAQSGDDANVKRAASASLPVIRMHQQMAEQLMAKLGGA